MRLLQRLLRLKKRLLLNKRFERNDNRFRKFFD